MITWAFAYMIVNAVAVPWWAFIVSILADLVFGQMITDAIKGRPAVASKSDNSRNPDDHRATNGYQANKPGNNVEPIKPPEKP